MEFDNLDFRKYALSSRTSRIRLTCVKDAKPEDIHFKFISESEDGNHYVRTRSTWK